MTAELPENELTIRPAQARRSGTQPGTNNGAADNRK